MHVAVIGLGYVGLPLACLCAKKGHTVIGITIDEAAVRKINRKESPIRDESLQRSLREVSLQATTDFS
ncbi:MAG: hypothetical protein GXP63_07630, partial [DPANN group archaeon]|nr:hypothetical protein [DPANN group archaeon]